MVDCLRYYESEEELLEVANSANGRRFGDFDLTGRLDATNKGDLGQIMEVGLFDRYVNSNQVPDIEELGVEIKVTPIKQNKNKTLSAKERLVLNIINYMKEYEFEFKTSSFWRKNARILMMFYLWEAEKSKGDYRILKSIIYDYPEEDLLVIERDWNIIVDKIKKGKAHELSEGDTMYLGACTKGASAKSVRQQPFSDIPAKQRAFSFKQSYMTTLVRQLFDSEKVEKFASKAELEQYSIEELIQQRFNPYMGQTVSEISQAIGYQINPSNKSTIANLISHLLGISGTRLDDIAEFAKAKITFKTIQLEPNGVPRESMSFEQVDFKAWYYEDEFENSQFYQTFETTNFLFVIFQHTEKKVKGVSRDPLLSKVILWNMPEETIQTHVKTMWETGRTILHEGIQFEKRGKRIFNNLPGQADNPVCHIRPKASNRMDTVQLPNGQEITKQTYWLNRTYIAKIIADYRK